MKEKGEQFTARQVRWFDRLKEFALEFQHIPGPSNAAADALSRSPVETEVVECITAIEVVAGPVATLCADELVEAAKMDPEYRKEVERLQQGGAKRSWALDDQDLL